MQLASTATNTLLGELALRLLAEEAKRRKAFHLAEKGQKVYLAADFAKKYNISEGPYTVEKTEGEGDDQFADLVELRGVGGGPWPLRAKDFLAAPATKTPNVPPMFPEEDQMAINAAADKFEAAVNARVARTGERWDEAMHAIALIDRDGAEAYHLRPLGAVAPEVPTKPVPMFNLSADVASKADGGAVPFHELVSQHARETGKDYRTATRELAIMYPELADAR